MIFYEYLLILQLFSYTAISQRNTVSCISIPLSTTSGSLYKAFEQINVTKHITP